MKKKIIMVLGIVSIALLSLGGTLAYLADETDSYDNVFTVGNAYIEQKEYQKDSNGELVDFEQSKQLLPGTSQDKIVKVKNIGTVDVYYRTIVAVEAPEAVRNGVVINKNDSENIVWTTVDGYTTIGETDYQLYVATYQAPLAADIESEATLEGIEMASFVTNETIKEFGTEVDVLVVSQAVQAGGFENGAEAALNKVFGRITDAVNPWNPAVEITSSEQLAETIKSAEKEVTVKLTEGTYTLPSVSDKEVTIVGTEETVINAYNAVTESGSTIVFDGVTVNFDNDNYEGLQHAKKVVYKNATLSGTQFLYAENVEFENCTFVAHSEKTEYSVWTYGSKNVTFTNCTFYTGGKALLVYTEGEHHATITVENCTFISDGTVATDKAAVEVGASASSADTTYNIIINNSTAEGFAANKSTSPLWGNKNSMDTDHLNVVIDGEDVY